MIENPASASGVGWEFLVMDHEISATETGRAVRVRDLADEFRLDRKALLRFIRESGIELRMARVPGDRKEAWVVTQDGANRIRQLRRELTGVVRIRDLARELKLTHENLMNFIRRMGIEPYRARLPERRNYPSWAVSQVAADQVRTLMRNSVPIRDLAIELEIESRTLQNFIQRLDVWCEVGPVQTGNGYRSGWIVNRSDVDRIKQEWRLAGTAAIPDGMVARKRAYCAELDPNNAQRTLMKKHAGCARFAWNWGLARKKETYEKNGESIGWAELSREWTIAKREQFPWALEVSSLTTQMPFQRLDAAFSRFYSGDGRHPRPKTKCRGRESFYLSGERTRVEEKRIQLPRFGWVRLKRHGYLPTKAKIESTTVHEHAGRWFVSIQVDEIHPTPIAPTGPPVGVDLGIKSFAVTSEGEEIQSPKPLAKSLKKMRRLQKQLSRKQMGSKNREKARKKFANLHYRIACRRRNFTNNVSSRLSKGNSVVAVESLSINLMVKNHSLARSINDAGWGSFQRQLKYKCQWYGSTLVEVNRLFASTKTCSQCGNKKEMPLSERVYDCLECGHKMNRDLNAAKNILKEGLKQVRIGHPELKPVEEAGMPAR